MKRLSVLFCLLAVSVFAGIEPRQDFATDTTNTMRARSLTFMQNSSQALGWRFTEGGQPKNLTGGVARFWFTDAGRSWLVVSTGTLENATNGQTLFNLTPAKLATNGTMNFRIDVGDGTTTLAYAFGELIMKEDITSTGAIQLDVLRLVNWDLYTFTGTPPYAPAPTNAWTPGLFLTSSDGGTSTYAAAVGAAATNGLISKVEADLTYLPTNTPYASTGYVGAAVAAVPVPSLSNVLVSGNIASRPLILRNGGAGMPFISWSFDPGATNRMVQNPATYDNGFDFYTPSMAGTVAVESQIATAVTAGTNALLLEVESNYLALAGGTVTGRVYSTADHTVNAPSGNEFPTADWVRGLAISGAEWYLTTNRVTLLPDVLAKSTNAVYLSSDAVTDAFTNSIVGPTNGQYLAAGVSTQSYTALRGPVAFEMYLSLSGGNPASTIAVHPEVYYFYNGGVSTNLLGDWEVANQVVTASATTPTRYMFNVAFPDPTITGSVRIVGALRCGPVAGASAKLNIVGGGIYPSHMDIQNVPAGVADGGAIAASYTADTTNGYNSTTRTLLLATNAFGGGSGGGGTSLTISNVMPLTVMNTGYRIGAGASNSAWYGPDSGLGVIAGVETTDATNDLKIAFGFINQSSNRDEVYGSFSCVIPIGVTNATSILMPVYQSQTNGDPVVWRLADGINALSITSTVTAQNAWTNQLLSIAAGTPWIREHKRISFRGLFNGGSMTNGIPRYTLFQAPSIVQ